MNKKIRIGSRESKLAKLQAEIVARSIQKQYPDIQLEMVTFKTTGDQILNRTLDKIGGKGLFIKELEQALLDNHIDFAVHSYKDMPFQENEDLPIVALSEREDPRDVLIFPINDNKGNIMEPVGSSSLRRKIQLGSIYKNIRVEPLRGNIITRLEKLDNGYYGSIVLALAGLIRAGLQHRASRIFSIHEMLPSASQGILSIQGRKGEDYSYLDFFNSPSSQIVSDAEREFIKNLNGGCSSPVAAYAQLHGNELVLYGMNVDAENNIYKEKIVGDIKDSRKMAEKLATILIQKADHFQGGMR